MASKTTPKRNKTVTVTISVDPSTRAIARKAVAAKLHRNVSDFFECAAWQLARDELLV